MYGRGQRWKYSRCARAHASPPATPATTSASAMRSACARRASLALQHPRPRGRRPAPDAGFGSSAARASPQCLRRTPGPSDAHQSAHVGRPASCCMQAALCTLTAAGGRAVPQLLAAEPPPGPAGSDAGARRTQCRARHCISTHRQAGVERGAVVADQQRALDLGLGRAGRARVLGRPRAARRERRAAAQRRAGRAQRQPARLRQVLEERGAAVWRRARAPPSRARGPDSAAEPL